MCLRILVFPLSQKVELVFAEFMSASCKGFCFFATVLKLRLGPEFTLVSVVSFLFVFS